MTNEIWKDIVGYEGLYRISSFGRIKSNYRKESAIGHILTAQLDSEGYPYVRLFKNGQMKIYRVHGLVLMTFCGSRPYGYQCCHKDGNRQNYTMDNLRWGTPLDNAADAIRHDTTVRGECHGRSKLTNQYVFEIKSLLLKGWSLRKLATKFGVDPKTIHAIKSGKTWIHLNVNI